MDVPRMRFHWTLSSVGDRMRGAKAQTALSGAPDPETHVAFCREAERCGIDAMLMAFRFHRPDPFVWSAALGMRTESLRFLVAIRSGMSSPTYFVQQVNTLSEVTDGRVCINIVTGRAPVELQYYGDFLDHDARYERTNEFWEVCHALWRNEGPVDFAGKHYQIEGAQLSRPFAGGDRTRPEVFLGGGSEQAAELAIRHADCLLTLPDATDRLASRIRPVVDSGTEVGLMVTMIAKRTREEAVGAAEALVEPAGRSAREVHTEARSKTDSIGFGSVYASAQDEAQWLSPTLWTGAVPYFGPPAIALVGSAEDLVDAIFAYREIGISQYLFTGHPDHEQMVFFGDEILPRVREREDALNRQDP
ncbi:MAG: LLM class flavin-dependent oxidoreductase [Streptomycetales bacterium]